MTHKFRYCECVIPQLRGKATIEVGDTFEFDFFLTNYGEPLDLTGAAVVLTLVDDKYETSVTIVRDEGNGGITIFNPAQGHGKGVLDPADTQALGEDGGPLFYELVVTDGDGNVFTALQGTILLVK